MNETAVVDFYNLQNGDGYIELEVPLFITANEFVLALNETYQLGMNTEDIFSCYLAAENPIAFLRGNKSLKEFGIRNGSRIIYRRG